jgi:hypothetical protein
MVQNRKYNRYKKKVQEPVLNVRPKLNDDKTMISAAPCFSGTCGLCASCCRNTDSSKLGEKERRYNDMTKLMGKTLIEEYRVIYTGRLNHWAKSRGYTDPQFPGIASKKVKYNEEMFTLRQSNHNDVCDHPYCRVLYNSENEYTQKKRYVKYPIYKSNTRDIKLCGVCMDRSINSIN